MPPPEPVKEIIPPKPTLSGIVLHDYDGSEDGITDERVLPIQTGELIIQIEPEPNQDRWSAGIGPSGRRGLFPDSRVHFNHPAKVH